MQHVAHVMGGQGGDRGFGLIGPGNRLGAGGFHRAVFGQQRQGVLQIALGLVALFDGALPERPFVGIGQRHRFDHRQGQLTLAEIIADVLARRGSIAAVVQQVIDDLKGNSQASP